MKLATLCLLLVCARLVVDAQTRDVALLVAECVAAKGLCNTQELVAYHFKNGVLTSRGLIVKANTDHVRFDLDKNHICRNRYVITNWGDVVDIQNREVLHEGEGEYVTTENNLIIQHVDKADLRGYYAYDLNTKQYLPLKWPAKWALP